MVLLELLGETHPAVGLVFAAIVGRIVLAWLPAGEPGRCAPGHLVQTWAASHVLGLAWLAAQVHAMRALGLSRAPLWIAAPWVLAAGLRWLTLPGDMVPRHEPAREGGGRAAAGASALSIGLTAAGIAYVGARGPSQVGARWLEGACLAACIIWVGRALATTRRAPVGRHLVAAAVALVPLVLASAWRDRGSLPLTHAALWAAAASSAVAWLRRADARGRALALVALAAPTLLEPSWLPFSAGGLLALVLYSARPARAGTAWACAAALLVAASASAAASHAAGLAAPPADDGHGVALLAADGIWLLSWVAAAAALSLLQKVPPRAEARGPTDSTPIDAPSREQRFVSTFGALAALALLLRGGGSLSPASLTPLAAIYLGMRAVRAERPGRGC